MGLDYKTCIGASSWDGSVGAGATAFGERGGTMGYNGVGDYTFTLDKGVDNTEGAVLCCLLATNDLVVRQVNTSDVAKQFLVETLAGVANECDINVLVVRFAP